MATFAALQDPSTVPSSGAAYRLAQAQAANAAYMQGTAPVLPKMGTPPPSADTTIRVYDTTGLSDPANQQGRALDLTPQQYYERYGMTDAQSEALKYQRLNDPATYYSMNMQSMQGMSLSQIASKYGPGAADYVQEYYTRHPTAAFQNITAQYQQQQNRVVGAEGGVMYQGKPAETNPYPEDSAAGIAWLVGRQGGAVDITVAQKAVAQGMDPSQIIIPTTQYVERPTLPAVTYTGMKGTTISAPEVRWEEPVRVNVTLAEAIANPKIQIASGINVAPYRTRSESNLPQTARDSELGMLTGGKTVAGTSALVDVTGPEMVNVYMPYGERKQIEVRDAKILMSRETGELGVYQKNKYGVWSLIGGGSRYSLQSGMFSVGKAYTPAVYTQESAGERFAASADPTAALAMLANPESYSRLGAEGYAGFVRPLDNRKLPSNAAVSRYGNPENLANYVNQVAGGKAEAPGADIPWTVSPKTGAVGYMGPSGETGEYLDLVKMGIVREQKTASGAAPVPSTQQQQIGGSTLTFTPVGKFGKQYDRMETVIRPSDITLAVQNIGFGAGDLLVAAARPIPGVGLALQTAQSTGLIPSTPLGATPVGGVARDITEFYFPGANITTSYGAPVEKTISRDQLPKTGGADWTPKFIDTQTGKPSDVLTERKTEYYTDRWGGVHSVTTTTTTDIGKVDLRYTPIIAQGVTERESGDVYVSRELGLAKIAEGITPESIRANAPLVITAKAVTEPFVAGGMVKEAVLMYGPWGKFYSAEIAGEIRGPLERPVSTAVVNVGMAAGFGGFSRLAGYGISRAQAEAAKRGGEGAYGFLARNLPRAKTAMDVGLGGMYAFGTVGNMTRGFTDFSAEGTAYRFGEWKTTEAVPMIIGGAAGYKAPELITTAGVGIRFGAGYTSDFLTQSASKAYSRAGEAIWSMRQRASGFERGDFGAGPIFTDRTPPGSGTPMLAAPRPLLPAAGEAFAVTPEGARITIDIFEPTAGVRPAKPAYTPQLAMREEVPMLAEGRFSMAEFARGPQPVERVGGIQISGYLEPTKQFSLAGEAYTVPTGRVQYKSPLTQPQRQYALPPGQEFALVDPSPMAYRTKYRYDAPVEPEKFVFWESMGRYEQAKKHEIMFSDIDVAHGLSGKQYQKPVALLPEPGKTATLWNVPVDIETSGMWAQAARLPVDERIALISREVGKPSGITRSQWETYAKETGTGMSLPEYRAMQITKLFADDIFEVGAIISAKGGTEGAILGFAKGFTPKTPKQIPSVQLWPARRSSYDVAQKLPGFVKEDFGTVEYHHHTVRGVEGSVWEGTVVSPFAPSGGDITIYAQVVGMAHNPIAHLIGGTVFGKPALLSYKPAKLPPDKTTDWLARSMKLAFNKRIKSPESEYANVPQNAHRFMEFIPEGKSSVKTMQAIALSNDFIAVSKNYPGVDAALKLYDIGGKKATLYAPAKQLEGPKPGKMHKLDLIRPDYNFPSVQRIQLTGGRPTGPRKLVTGAGQRVPGSAIEGDITSGGIFGQTVPGSSRIELPAKPAISYEAPVGQYGQIVPGSSADLKAIAQVGGILPGKMHMIPTAGTERIAAVMQEAWKANPNREVAVIFKGSEPVASVIGDAYSVPGDPISLFLAKNRPSGVSAREYGVVHTHRPGGSAYPSTPDINVAAQVRVGFEGVASEHGVKLYSMDRLERGYMKGTYDKTPMQVSDEYEFGTYRVMDKGTGAVPESDKARLWTDLMYEPGVETKSLAYPFASGKTQALSMSDTAARNTAMQRLKASSDLGNYNAAVLEEMEARFAPKAPPGRKLNMQEAAEVASKMYFRTSKQSKADAHYMRPGGGRVGAVAPLSDYIGTAEFGGRLHMAPAPEGKVRVGETFMQSYGKPKPKAAEVEPIAGFYGSRLTEAEVTPPEFIQPIIEDIPITKAELPVIQEPFETAMSRPVASERFIQKKPVRFAPSPITSAVRTRELASRKVKIKKGMQQLHSAPQRVSSAESALSRTYEPLSPLREISTEQPVAIFEAPGISAGGRVVNFRKAFEAKHPHPEEDLLKGLSARQKWKVRSEQEAMHEARQREQEWQFERSGLAGLSGPLHRGPTRGGAALSGGGLGGSVKSPTIQSPASKGMGSGFGGASSLRGALTQMPRMSSMESIVGTPLGRTRRRSRIVEESIEYQYWTHPEMHSPRAQATEQGIAVFTGIGEMEAIVGRRTSLGMLSSKERGLTKRETVDLAIRARERVKPRVSSIAVITMGVANAAKVRSVFGEITGMRTDLAVSAKPRALRASVKPISGVKFGTESIISPRSAQTQASISWQIQTTKQTQKQISAVTQVAKTTGSSIFKPVVKPTIGGGSSWEYTYTPPTPKKPPGGFGWPGRSTGGTGAGGRGFFAHREVLPLEREFFGSRPAFYNPQPIRKVRKTRK